MSLVPLGMWALAVSHRRVVLHKVVLHISGTTSNRRFFVFLQVTGLLGG